ncbi:SsrA-binding protein SmpB [bacterium]|nr:SsrA-binding protein SmpB [bacterium]
MSLITTNKKALYNYEILEKFESGIILSGPEVKSVKNGQINLKDGYVSIDSNKTPWLINVHIAPYPPASQIQQDYNPTRARKLLLKKKEINYLFGKTKLKGLTIIPLKVYTKGGLIKVEIGLVRGKKKYDKREVIKKREVERKISQKLKTSI